MNLELCYADPSYLVKERNVKVLAGTLNESNKRGDWLKSWLMLNEYSAFNTMFRKTPHKQTSFVSPKGKEKQIDYILTKRRYLRNVKDAAANDMIHMGSDHRCIMATFLINTPGKNTHVRRETKEHETIGYVKHVRKEKNTNIEMTELEERYQEIVDTINKPPPKKKMKYMTQEINAKDQMERKNAAAAAAAESTLVDAEAQETERRSMIRSSTVTDQQGVPAQHEHRRQDGWTSTPRGSDDEKKGSERDTTAGERLQNQRPHPLVQIEDEEDAHEVDTGSGCSGGCDLLAGERLPKQRPLGDEHPERNSVEHLGAQVPHQVEEAGSIVFHFSSNASEFKNDNKEAQVTTSAAAKKNEECLDKDAEILRLIEERRNTPKEEKQRLKDLSERIKNASEEKMKRQKDIQRIFEEFKGVRNIPGIKTAKKRVLITKIKNDKGECITSRQGIADVFGEFYKRLYEDNERGDFEHEMSDDRRIP